MRAAMMAPYTSQPLDALMAAQTSVGIALAAAAWTHPLRPRIATWLFLLAVAFAVAAPVDADFLTGLGFTLSPLHVKHALEIAAALATLACVFTRKRSTAIVAVLGEVALYFITDYIEDCNPELAAGHLAFFGLLLGLHWRTHRAASAPASDVAGRASFAPELASPTAPASSAPGAAPSRGRAVWLSLQRWLSKWPSWKDDTGAFALGTVLAGIVCRVVLSAQTDTADEWAYTYQAALFTKLRAYETVPHCGEAFRSFWVFQYMGRSFAQYTPGWPYFLAIFMLFHLTWLAGPVSLGLLAAGVSRVTRRAMASSEIAGVRPSPQSARAAGWFSAIVICLGNTFLINGGSRYSHVFVAAVFAWSIEALFQIATPGLAPGQQRRWGLVLGGTAALLLATRPADGATLGLGLFVVFTFELAGQRLGWRSVAFAGAAFAALGGLTLVILRLQLGTWFTTGYSLNETIYPWNKFAYSLPKANEFKWGIPLGTGAYCWWPCSPAVGLLGIVTLRRPARRLAVLFFFSYVPFLIFYTLLEVGRGLDFGYGPRYELPLVVPMAVGTGIVLGHVWSRARTAPAAHEASGATALAQGGPAGLLLASVFLGVFRLAPLVFPPAYADVKSHQRLRDAIDAADLHDAVVFGGPGFVITDPKDLTENLPLSLFPDQDVLVAIDYAPEATRCVRTLYPHRTFFRATPGEPIRFSRF